MKKKIAMLIMVDGVVVGEKYFECIIHPKEEWITEEESIDQAQWFFY